MEKNYSVKINFESSLFLGPFHSLSQGALKLGRNHTSGPRDMNMVDRSIQNFFFVCIILLFPQNFWNLQVFAVPTILSLTYAHPSKIFL